MDIRRRILLVGASAVVLLLLLLIAVPLLFRDRIEARVQSELSDALEADIAWNGVGLSLLRGFPRATLRLDDLAVTGRDRFEGDTLAHIPRFQLALELPSVLRSLRGTGPLVVRSIEIDRPSVHLRVLEDGSASWDILGERDESEPASSSTLALELRRLEVRDGTVLVEDRQSGLHASVAGLRQSLTGDFRQSRFQLRSRTSSDAVSLRFAGVPYLSRVRLGVEAALDVDQETGRISVEETDIRLNDLRLALAGAVGLGADAVDLDLTFQAPGTDFQEILSLVPALYSQPGFADLRASGTMAVSGSVRGAYGPNAFPAFAVEAQVRDGRFQYPDLPLPARDVFLDLALTNPGGDLDHTIVRVDRFHVIIGNDPIEGAFAMRTPVSDPETDLRVRGRLDLADLNHTLKLPGTEELTGSIRADAAVKARLSDIDNQRYDRVAAEGTVYASQIVLRTEDLPHALQVEEGLLRLSPSHAELVEFRGKVGQSDLAITGRLDNLLGFAFRDEELRGQARIASAFFDLNEWRSDDEAQAVVVPRNLDFALEADVQRMAFADLDLRNAHGALTIRGERATLDDFRLEMFGGTLAVTGFYETTSPARPTFDVGLRITAFDVGQAATGLNTVRVLAPIARYAQGRVSTDLRLSGALGDDMLPVYEALSGRGSFEAVGVALQGFPGFERLAELLRTEQLRNPTLADVRSSFRIEDGRLHVNPFDVRLGQFTTTISGSHGLDETMDYTLALQMPRSLLGAEADRAVATLVSQAGRAGINWETTDVITLGVRLGGTVGQPMLATDFRGATTSVLQQAGSALREEADRRVEAVGQRVDAAADEARRRAEEEAQRILAEAERQAARLRSEAKALAETVRREGYESANALVARAGSPAARIAAEAGATRLRREADARAEQILREADVRADALVAEARQRADAGTE